MTRHLIVTADDFGLSVGVNAGVVRAHCDGIVTAASLMVRQAALDDAVRSASLHPDLDVGLHLDLGEWAFANGQWIAVYQRVDTADAAAVTREAAEQVAIFQRAMGRAPSHIDSHQHVHRNELVREVVTSLASRLEVPLRFATPAIAHVGEFYGQTTEGQPLHDYISVDHLVRLITGLADGVTEFGCHPATVVDYPGSYGAERLREVEVLCDPAVRAALVRSKVELIGFRAVVS